MRLAVGIPLGIALLVVVILITVDAVATPAATQGQCLLTRRYVLPDTCVNTCTGGFDCTLTRRPYLIVFSQAASCMDAVIC